MSTTQLDSRDQGDEGGKMYLERWAGTMKDRAVWWIHSEEALLFAVGKSDSSLLHPL